jgi:hypothetical protein
LPPLAFPEAAAPPDPSTKLVLPPLAVSPLSTLPHAPVAVLSAATSSVLQDPVFIARFLGSESPVVNAEQPPGSRKLVQKSDSLPGVENRCTSGTNGISWTLTWMRCDQVMTSVGREEGSSDDIR